MKGTAVFLAAILSESIVILMYFYFDDQIAYLWYNPIGCMLIILIAMVLNPLDGRLSNLIAGKSQD